MILKNKPIESLTKATDMYYLCIFMIYKGEPIMENQIAVVTELTRPTREGILYLFSTEEERVELSDIVNRLYQEIASQGHNIEIELPPELSYTTQLLAVMAVATEGK
jgi:hypothetical protein